LGSPIEKNFWLRLEHRVSREFPGMADKELQHFWCDGFSPHQYLFDDPVPRIVGRAWIVNVQHQEDWEFTLLLDRPYASREAIDWPSLLPPEDVTCWIALDRPCKRIQLEPSAAIRDFEKPPKRNAKNRGTTGM
jgi:hypothetical protein